MTCYAARSTILPNFITLRQLTPEIWVIKYFADMRTNSKRYMPAIPICMWGNKQEKVGKYQDLAREIKRLWKVEAMVISIVIGALGTIP